MLSISIDTAIEFISGPHVMGDVVAVEYMHQFIYNGSPRQDHNVSILIVLDSKVVKWVGYIHPK